MSSLQRIDDMQIEPIVITETMQIVLASLAIGGMVGYLFGWLRGVSQCDHEAQARKAKESNEQRP